MSELVIYNYDPITKEYTTSSTANKNPLNPNEPIIPACATKLKPLNKKEEYAIIWVGNKWEYKEDHRGEAWFNAKTNEIQIVDFIGELPNYFYTPDSPIANKPEGEYWQFDQELNEWIGNPILYKNYILNSFPNYWTEKQNIPFEFEGYKYIPSWRELYTSIWVALKDGIKNNYRLQDYDGNFNTVDVKSMKAIITKMSDVNDEMYLDKQNLELYFKTQNDFNKLQNKFNEWLNKKY